MRMYTILGLCATLGPLGCADANGESSQNLSNGIADGTVPADFLSSDGRRFVLTQRNVPIARPDNGTLQAERGSEFTQDHGKPVDAMSDDELAEALRPMTMINGHEYKFEAPDYEAVARVRANLLAEGSSHNPDGDTDIPEGKAYCCGSDGRTKVRTNTSFPYRTILVMAVPNNPNNLSWDINSVSGGCTMQLIGPFTAISAAHCFHDGSNWSALAMWGAGPDAQDAQIFPSGYPGAFGCYRVFIPSGWPGSNNQVGWDFAVIDFRNTCSPAPGNIVGWVGWGTYTAAQITGTSGRGYGVPGSVAAPQTFGVYPQIWGMSTTNIMTTDLINTFIDHGADCGGGDSGRGFRQFIDNDWRITGTHHAGPMGGKCRDRRLNSTYNSFIVANSEF